MDFSISKTFKKISDAYYTSKYRYIVNSGGSRSGKTYSIIQFFIILLLTKKNYKISCYRNLRVDCIDTVMQDAENIINSSATLSAQFLKNKKDATFTCKKTGSVISFAGTEKIHKSLGVQNDIIFLNEISEFSKDVFNQLDQRTRDFIFIDYNPSKDFWIEDYRENDKAIFLHSTYKDNIQFLTDGIVNKLEGYNPYEEGSTYVKDMKVYFGDKPVSDKNHPPPNVINVKNNTADKYMYEVYCLGLGSEKPNRVLKNWKRSTLEYFDNLEYKSYFGLDFGISSPTAVIEVKFDGDKTFFLKQRLYKPSSEMGMPIYKYLKDVLRIKSNDIVVCDSAKLSMVQDLQLGGLMAISALKGAGSREKSISQLQSFNVYYCETSKDLETEYLNYSYKTDRYGLVTDDVDPRSPDHLIDASKYIVSYLINYLGIKY